MPAKRFISAGFAISARARKQYELAQCTTALNRGISLLRLRGEVIMQASQ